MCGCVEGLSVWVCGGVKCVGVRRVKCVGVCRG